MIKNYFLVAIRNLRRHRFFSLINIFGLAISMSVCMAIIMLVADQMMYDRHNSKSDRIYRVISVPVNNVGANTDGMENSTSPQPLRGELLENYSGIEKVVRIKRGFGNNWMELDGQNVNIPLRGYFADPEFLEVFEYELEHGDPNTALNNPYTVVLTKKAARKLFKEENPIGLTIKMGEGEIYTVTGILKETTNKSHIVFEGIASMATVSSSKNSKDLNDWTNFWASWTYLVLEPGKTPDQAQQYLNTIYKKHIASNQDPESYKAKFRLQHLLDITPGKLINNPIGPFMPWIFIYFLGGLAVIIMLTSCFNFTNLSIARSLTRAREIGVRKVNGAGRIQIFSQFLLESVLIALVALIIAVLMMWFIKPLMLELSFAKALQWDLQANYMVYAVLIVFAITVGLLAGFFPAVILSGFQPLKVLKNFRENKIFSRMGLRKALIVVQFTLSLFFILSVIIIYNQLELFRGKDHGFNMSNTLVIKSKGAATLKTELLRHSNIKNVSASSHIPAAGMTKGSGFKKDLSEKEWTTLNHYSVDEDYVSNMELTLIAGNFFDARGEEFNKNLMVINEEALITLNFKNPSEALGQELIFAADSSHKKIVGVIKSYNHQFLLDRIAPMALMYAPENFEILQVKYTGSREAAAEVIQEAWAKTNPDLLVDFNDMDAEINKFYDIFFGDLVSIIGVIAFLAIFISSLGLLGMATYSTETRLKEISIRKVLGSSDKQLVVLLSSGFMKLLVIAVVIGVPLAWFVNNLWLELIPYRTTFHIGIIASGILILMTVGSITIGSQTLRAAFTNPVDNLKNE